MNHQSLQDLNHEADDYAIRVVDYLLGAAVDGGATDLHVSERDGQIDLRWRRSGQLMALPTIRDGRVSKVLGRIKALAHLVTYRSDIPQEGRMVLSGPDGQHLEARVGTLPTLRGERAVIRLAKRQAADWRPRDLGLPPAALERLQITLTQSSGAILICGPAGSGKTTTAYACLRSLGDSPHPRTIVTLEDPVEQELPFAAQSEIEPARDYDWSTGLRAVLRQDPEVLLIGEIRDAETANVVFQAALTGQLVLSTMHARSAADALRRLLDLGVPAHHLRSVLDLLICQRLVTPPTAALQPIPESASSALATLVAELLPPIAGSLAQAIVQDADTVTLHTAACELGMQPLDQGMAQAKASFIQHPENVDPLANISPSHPQGRHDD